MFAVIGVVGGLVLVGLLVWLVYAAGNRGRGQAQADRETADRGLNSSPHQPPRSQGRGDL